MLQPRVTPSLPIGREGSLFQRVFSGMSGIDPYAAAVSDVYQDLFGEGSYAGKGIYEVDAFEAALAGRVPDFDAAQPRSVRGRLRPRRSRVRRRGGRGVPRPLRRRGRCGTTAGRAATGNCCRGSSVAARVAGGGSERAAPSRRSAAGRCSTICGARCRRRLQSSPCWPGWTLPFDAAAIWTFFILATIVLPTLLPVVAAIVPRRAGITAAQPPARARRRSPPRSRPVGAHDQLPGPSGVADGRCDRTNAVPAVRHPPASARMGYGRAGERSVRGSTFSASIGGWPAAVVIAAVAVIVASAWRARDLAARAAVRGALDRLAGDRALDEPLSGRGGPAADVRRRRPRPATDRAPDLALLRDLRDAGRSHAAAGQFPGRPGAGAGASDLADQSRPLSAVGGERPRLRLDGNDRGGRAAGGDALDDEPARALPRPFLQLVRHAGSAAARSPIHILRR